LTDPAAICEMMIVAANRIFCHREGNRTFLEQILLSLHCCLFLLAEVIGRETHDEVCLYLFLVFRDRHTVEFPHMEAVLTIMIFLVFGEIDVAISPGTLKS
jgi:hypothetical protein